MMFKGIRGWTALSLLTIVCAFLVLARPHAVAADSPPEGAAYLVDEDFSFLSNLVPGESQPSGWDIRAAGGALVSTYATTLKVSDTSSVLPVSMSRKFPAQSETTLTMEYRFKPLAIINGIKWQLLDGDTPGVSIATSGGNLVLETSGGGIHTLQAYSANTEYGIKVVADLTSSQADVYVNGVKKATAASFANSVNALNRFQLSTGASSTGDFFFTPLKIYKGYAVNERLLSVVSGFLPQDWSASAASGTIAVEQMSGGSSSQLYVMSPRPDLYSIRMNAASATGAMELAKSFAPLTDDLTAEFKLFIPVKTNGLAAELRSGSNTALKLVTSNGKLSYLDRDGLPVELYDYKANLWYSLKVKLKWTSSALLADIYINGKLQAEDIELDEGISLIDGIRFSTSAADKGTMWLDDILVYENTPLQEDYVPQPVAVSTGDQLVGVQSCPMWREGTHLGWDMINPFPDRTPYLGFYDEGNPETADWEIKWMVEHGIGFQMSCWFRPIGGENAPVKDSFMSNALHDGYFNAQYSDQLQFAIMWENLNSRAADSNDFRTNLVPYWVEYYFKDPRYLKIDNKPVFTIYNYNEFVKLSGSIIGAKADIDYLRNAAIAAGFDDLIILNVYNGTSAQDLINRRSAGFDAVYAYSWGSFGGHQEFQKLRLTTESGFGELDVIAGLSMGRDDTAWGLASGYYATPGEFKSLAQWTKDSYIPSLSADNLGKKLVMLDNWNEFGEGHFLMPAGLAGFGYVDAIRDVFAAGAGTHTDAVPSQDQKDRIGVLYPADRIVPNRTLSPPAISANSVVSWEFNTDGDSEGWSVLKQIVSAGVSDGSFTGTSNNTDPGIISADHLGIRAEDVPYLKIRMKNDANDIDGRVFFTTELDGDWNETKAMGFYVNPQDDGYTDYYVEMWRNKSWKGNIRQIRIDPISATGKISIDYIRAVADDSTDIKLYLDGKRRSFSQPPLVLDNVPMIPIKDVWLLMGVKSEWDAAAQKLIGVSAKGGSVHELAVGSMAALKDGQSVALDHSPVLLPNGTVLAPLTYLRHAFGSTVSWDDITGKIGIYPGGVLWDFEFADGWTANGQIEDSVVLGGTFDGVSLGVSGATEPAISSPDLLELDAASIKRIRVKLRNGTAGNEARIYYTVNGDTAWNELKMISSYILPNEPLYREYVFDATAAAGWTGVIRQIKIVPTRSSGDFSLDSVQLDTETSLSILGDNLVTDPGMEGKTLSAMTQNTALGLDSSQFHSGRQSLKVIKNGRYSSAMFKLNGVVQGQEYRYSIWSKLAAEPTLSEPLRLCLQYTVDGQVKQFIMYTSPGLSAQKWTQVQGNYTIAETSAVSNVYLFVYTEVDGNHDYYVDDVEARPVTYSTSPTWVNVTGLSLEAATTVYYGETLTLKPTFQPASGVGNKELIWSSDRPEVAVVDINGTVYGKGLGTAQISAMSADGGFVATTAVTVALSPSLAANAVLESNLIVDGGMEGSALPSAYYGSSATVSLVSSEHRNGAQGLRVVKMNNNRYAAVFMPVAVEKSKLYYYSAWGKLGAAPTSPGLLRICLQYKLDGVVQQKILFTSATLGYAGWVQAQGFYEIQETGVVTDTRLYLYTEQLGAVQDFYVDDVEVREVSYAATGIELNKSATVIPLGQTETLVATVLPANATDKSVVWSSANPAVATVDSDGTVTAIDEGTAVITAMTADGGFVMSAMVNVDATAPITTAVLSPAPDGSGGTYEGPVSLTLTATDGISGIQQTEYSLDSGATWLPYSMALEFSKQGSYTVQYKSTDLAGNTETAASVSFSLTATATTIELKDSEGNPISGAMVKYFDGTWKELGVTDASGQATKSLPERSYTFSMTYRGVTKQLARNTAVDTAEVVFQTVKARVQLLDSGDNGLAGGSARVYTGGSWQTIGTTGAEEIGMELLAGSYTFGMTYEGAYNELVQDIGHDGTVVFRTTNVLIGLEDALGNSVDGGQAKFYSGGSWRVIGSTVGGKVRKELLPATYTFGMTYGTALPNVQQNIAADSTVVFQIP
ncbi:Ig-like domain-containing protein [Paenibacillus paridis]|uniref:Ig-like domain-containing protein n=1 Tax=Paenibacillus paridis TaxID=2583376 RepID=UPI00111F1CDC|nr:Ig-like domain-containing protein [Paenibacillus paridis]